MPIDRPALDERWETRDEVLAARDRYEGALEGYERPARFGVGIGTPSTDGLWFPYVCHGDHPLPAAVLAFVTGHRSGAARYELTVEQLDEVIGRLAPAGACPDFEHPNLAAWRQVRAAVPADPPAGDTYRIVAVFDGDPPTEGCWPDA